MKRLKLSLLAAAVLAVPAIAHSASAGSTAKERYTTPLADVCPNPFIIQKDWLAQAEHGGLYELIGPDGEMSSGQYTGPLGSTGINLTILEGGGGIGLGDGETAYSALHMGNSKANVVPHLGFQELDGAFIFSKRFPVVGVVAPLEKAPQGLWWDRGTYPDGFHSIDDLKAFAESGKGMIYVSTIQRTFGLWLVESGVKREAFVEGYRGDGENFVTSNGTWLNQGFMTSEPYKFANGFNWNKPIDAVTVGELGYENYTGLLAVATHRLEELAPCLEKIVPLIQQGFVDYINDPAEINKLIYEFNAAGNATSWWTTPMGLMEYGSQTMRDAGIVSNGNNETVGDFDMARVNRMYEIVKPWLDERSNPDLKPEDIITNRFIDPSIGFKK